MIYFPLRLIVNDGCKGTQPQNKDTHSAAPATTSLVCSAHLVDLRADMLCSGRFFSSIKPLLSWHFYNHRKLPSAGGADVQWMGDGFILLFFLLRAKFSPTRPCTATGTIFCFLRGEHVRPLPNWTATTCSSDFWEKLISCPRLWEGSLLLQTSRVTGVNSPTRGRFTAADRNHLSALCCLSPNRPDRAALGQSHRSKKCLIELKMNRRDTSWGMVVSCQWRSSHYAVIEGIFYVGYYYPCGQSILGDFFHQPVV